MKGSYKGRSAIKKKKDVQSLKQLPLNEAFDTILKDNDFDKLKSSIGHVRLGDQKKVLFTNAMRADVNFLQRHEIMDYSLIVSIHFKTDAYRDLISRRNSEDIRDPVPTQRGLRGTGFLET